MKLPDVGLGPRGPERHDDGEGHFDAVDVGANEHRVPVVVAPRGGHETGPQDGGSDTSPRGATGDDVAQGHRDLPDADLEGQTMAASERLWLAARFWVRQAGTTAKAKVTSPGGLYHAQPESLAQHDERIARHEWVPEGYEGKWLAHLGVAHRQSFGKFGKVTGYVWAWLWDTPIAFYPTLLVVLIFAALIRYGPI